MVDNWPDARSVRRSFRVIAILASAESAGLGPIPALDLQAMSYFADALAPVWGVEVVDGRLRKRREGPSSPAIQADVDRLVGQGMLLVSNLSYDQDSEGSWRINSDYSLNEEFCAPVLRAAGEVRALASELDYVKEVVLALSGFGVLGIGKAIDVDAAYSDEMIDVGGLVDITDKGHPNFSARVALRIGELASPDLLVGDAEKVHLYLRELYSRVVHGD
jgi:hypothetical protein